MRLRPLPSFVLLLATLSTSACSGGGAKGPDIRSFEATPANLPSLGGDVTLVWDVTQGSELTLEPGVGAVTGTSATVNVTSTTTFTLTAKKNGRSDRSHTTVAVAGPTTVVGTVRTLLSRVPAPDLVVWIAGHGATFTAEDGTFAFENVQTPYDIAVIDPVDAIAILYLDVTRTEPVLELDDDMGNFRSGTVSGSISPAEPAGTETMVYMDSPEALPSGQNVDGTYSLGASWFNEDTTRVAVHALRWVVGTAGVVSYTGYVRGEADVVSGQDTPMDLTLGVTGTDETTVEYTLHPATMLVERNAYLIFGEPTGTFADEGFFLPTGATVPESLPVGEQSFVLRTPTLTGANTGLRFRVSGSDGQAILYRNVETGGTVQLDLPRTPRLLTPVSGGTVARDTIFHSETRGDSLKVHLFQVPGPPPQPPFFFPTAPFATLAVVTTRDSFTLPDLSEVGMDLYDWDGFTWELYAEVAPRDSVDDAVGPEGLIGTSPEYYGTASERSLTVLAQD